jgi:hypothetical protein
MNQDNRLKLAHSEFKMAQQQMDKYDNLLSQVKTWTVTLWAASIGWSFQSRIKELVLLSAFIAMIFWFLDAFKKNFRQDYKRRREEVSEALRTYYQSGNLPQGFVSPDLPKHRIIRVVKYIFQPHVFLFYLPLAIISFFLYRFVF